MTIINYIWPWCACFVRIKIYSACVTPGKKKSLLITRNKPELL